MTPETQAAIAAGLLDCLPVMGQLATRLEALSAPLVEAERGDLALPLWSALGGVQTALEAVADATAAAASADALAHDLTEAPAEPAPGS